MAFHKLLIITKKFYITNLKVMEIAIKCVYYKSISTTTLLVFKNTLKSLF